MNNEQNNHSVATIHDFDFALICDFFLSLDRQGPGSKEMTLRALSFIDGLNADSRIADLGCGTGGQTMTLAAATPGHITGLDLFAPFIERFEEQAWDQGVRGRVQGVVGSMDDLPFAENSLDLIWCEGAIYHIGFERGLREWRKYLKTNGYVAVTENTWFTDERPAEIQAFWDAAYPGIDTAAAKVSSMQHTGYEFIAAFSLPESCWETYYASLPQAQKIFLKKHAGNPAAEAFLAGERDEKSLWDRNKAHYGLVFYIGRKRA